MKYTKDFMSHTFYEPMKNESLEQKIKETEVFMSLCTTNYLKDLRDPTSWVSIQATIAKLHDKPVILLISSELNESEITEIRQYFAQHRVIKELPTTAGDWNKILKGMLDITKKQRKDTNPNGSTDI